MNWFEKRRKELGLTREQVAAKASVSYNTIKHLEQGIKKPRRATVHVVEEVLAEPCKT